MGLKSANPRKASLAVNRLNEQLIRIEFPFDTFTLQRVRKLPGLLYHQDIKCYSCPLTIQNIEQLLFFSFELDPELQEYLTKARDREERLIVGEIPGLGGQLRPFQYKGVAFIEKRQGRALIADEMGLGKTVQALAWLQLHRDRVPAIIVVQSNVKINWKREAQKWLQNPSVEVLSGRRNWIPKADYIIINYDILADWWETLRNLNPKVLILDEAHLIKNDGTRRTKAFKMLVKNIPYVIGLTGTPIENRPIDIFNIGFAIDPAVFKSKWQFINEYCNAHKTAFGLDYKGASNQKKLHELLESTFMIRRLKSDVLPELPPKTTSVIPVEIENKRQYKEAERDLISFLHRTKGEEFARRAVRAEALVYISTMRQLAVEGKMDLIIEWIYNVLDNEDKLVLFTMHTSVIDRLMAEFNKHEKIAVRYDGSITNDVMRQDIVDQFQNNPKIKLFIGNIKAAGRAITLTAASHVAFIELPWNPSTLDQAADRCHRITQKDAVNVYHLIAENTIEERLARIIDQKRSIITPAVDGEDPEDSDMLIHLLKEYKEEA